MSAPDSPVSPGDDDVFPGDDDVSPWDSTNTAPDETATLHRLAKYLRAHDRWGLAFATVIGAPRRDALFAALKAHDPALRWIDLDHRAPGGRLLDRVRRELARDSAANANVRPDAIFMWGLENWILEPPDDDATQFLAGVNRNRNSLTASLPCPLVIWCAPGVVAAFQDNAGDFFSIRDTFFDFTARDPSNSNPVAPDLVRGSYADAALSPGERDALTNELYERLGDVRVSPDGRDKNAALIRVLQRLGDVLWVSGRYDEALPLYERALDIRETQLGATHPDTATSLHNLALFYADKGAWDKALPLMRRAVAICQTALGPGHPHTQNSMQSLATMLRDSGTITQEQFVEMRAQAAREAEKGTVEPP